MSQGSERANKLGYQFQDPLLLERALTHASYADHDNQRLEFLGDACLGFIVAEMLADLHPDLTEGDLTRLRAHLVKKSSLVVLAKALSLDSLLKVGKTHENRVSEKMLADALEALVAAVYRDAGWKAVSEHVRGWYHVHFSDVLSNCSVQKDAKTRLQEWCQARGHSLPEYTIVASGLDADLPFAGKVVVQSVGLQASGVGKNKREAEMHAAQVLLDRQGE